MKKLIPTFALALMSLALALPSLAKEIRSVNSFPLVVTADLMEVLSK